MALPFKPVKPNKAAKELCMDLDKLSKSMGMDLESTIVYVLKVGLDTIKGVNNGTP